MTSLAPAGHSPGSYVPLTPLAGGREVLLARFETVSLRRYFEGLRFLYRLATCPDSSLGVLVPDLAQRYPPQRPPAKAPPLNIAKIEHSIRSELGLPAHHPLTKDHTLRWLARRDEAVASGLRDTRLDPDEEEVIVPRWACEAMAVCLDHGPALTRDRVERWGVRFANGLDDFVSKKGSDEESREYPTPATVDRAKDVYISLFSNGVKRIRNRYGDQAPPWLRPWPGDWDDLKFGPHERAIAKRRRRTTDAKVRDAFAISDQICAAPFYARFGASDIEIAADPERFWSSFESRLEAGRWLFNKNVAIEIRDRGMASLGIVLGERCPELAASMRADLHLKGFSHPALSESFGITDIVGALFVRASAKTREQIGAHYCPIPSQSAARVRPWLLASEVLRGAPLADTDPLFLNSITATTPKGLHQESIGAAVGRFLARHGAIPAVYRGSAGYNAIRRLTDQIILDYFDEWSRGREDVRRGITAVAVKEATLGHARIGIDPHTYSGLSDDEGRFLLSAYGAEVVADVIWGKLGRRRGPDEIRIRDGLATQRALEQTRGRLRRESADIKQAALGEDPSQGAADLTTIVKIIDLADLREELTERIAAQQAAVKELFEDRDLWVDLKEGEKALTKAGLRALSDDLLGNRRSSFPPVRDFCYLKELAQLLGVDPGTVREWLNSEAPEGFSRLCPWVGPAPIYRPDERTVLFAVATFEEARVASVDRWAALRRLLSTWPQGRGWDPRNGAKTNMVRKLNQSPIVLPQLPANNLLAGAAEHCVRVFSLAQAAVFD